jgi:GNAT superfamily N-acetyltransferase
MSTQISISTIIPGEEQQALDLVRQVFDSNVAPTYSDEGNEEFYKYLRLDDFLKRIQDNHLVFVAKDSANVIVGILELRASSHISLLFVRDDLQRSGIGRTLVAQAISVAKSVGITSLSVNSSPNAVSAYESYGFRADSGERIINGIRFVPMTMDL